MGNQSYDNYMEVINNSKNKSSSQISEDVYRGQVQQANQSAMVGNQQAYVLNERLKKYVSQVNSGYGQRGLTQGDMININNQYQSSLGQVQMNKDALVNDAYSNFIGRTYNQRAEQESTQSERAYQNAVMERQFQNQQTLLNQAWEREQQAQTQEEQQAARLEIRDSIIGLMLPYISGIPSQATSEQAYRRFENEFRRYFGNLSSEDMRYLRIQFENIYANRR